MQNFNCGNCGQKVYFDNTACVNCGFTLGFEPGLLNLVAIGDDLENTCAERPEEGSSATTRLCANAQYDACNWLTEGSAGALCKACAVNRTIPDLSSASNLAAWRALERAKKRLIYSLLRFGLPFSEEDLPEMPLTFDFRQDAMTGHEAGRVTIDIAEANTVERERQRQLFGEAYRSLLGHLRHESGHFYWMLLIERGGRLDAFRTAFGDERLDYGAALERHHTQGPPADWQTTYVSGYASAHPWEDWAESWAHYLHMIDVLDTAQAVGGGFAPALEGDVYREVPFDDLMASWVPLTDALNSLSRSMGHEDFYPFVIPAPAGDKLAFVHETVHGWLSEQTTA